MTEEELILEYRADAHAMQTGVAAMMPSAETEPKHLRVGVNTALVDHAGLVDLLIELGVITRKQYLCAIAIKMRAGKDLYELQVNEKHQAGGRIKLR